MKSVKLIYYELLLNIKGSAIPINKKVFQKDR